MSAEELATALTDAAAAWGDAPVEVNVPVTRWKPLAAEDARNTVGFVRLPSDHRDLFDDPDAVTHVRDVKQEIVEVDVEIDQNSSLWSGPERLAALRALLVHELGHVFGLGHCEAACGDPTICEPTICEHSVMRPDVLESAKGHYEQVRPSAADRRCLRRQLHSER